MKKKIRVNITVDTDLLNEAKKKLGLFGGKLSTLFNAYLADFVKSMEQLPEKNTKELAKKFKDFEERLKKLEKKFD